MTRAALGAFVALLPVTSAIPAAAVMPILLSARDFEARDSGLPGVCFSFSGTESLPTNRAGATELNLPSAYPAGRQITIALVRGGKCSNDWLLTNEQVNVPGASEPVQVVLIRRSTYLKITAMALDAQRLAEHGEAQRAAEEPKRALAEAGAQFGLSPQQVEAALRSLAATQDPKDRGIASYFDGQYAQAEELLAGAVEKKTSDLVDTLRYLGAARYDQGKYQAAVETFRTALGLRPEDTGLLSWLVCSLQELAAWPEAEPLTRRALSISEKSYGPNHPSVATALNNLAQLLQATNRPVEAEPLLRRALSIDEKSYGPDHPKVAGCLLNLAQLLKDTDRLVEAEPLMLRALSIFEKSFGPDHPNVATCLNSLAQLLQNTKRPSEPEPLLRRSLTIDEKSFGPDHPKVARDLNNLAQLLKAPNRLGEAEPLMRRALSIDEKSYGPDHPSVAIRLNNLAALLYDTNRMVEAEPMMRRALSIDEKSYGPGHPGVASDLNNLAKLLQATNRLVEAEPLMRKSVEILFAFARQTGHKHPNEPVVLANYRALLTAMGKSDDETRAAIRALVHPPP